MENKMEIPGIQPQQMQVNMGQVLQTTFDNHILINALITLCIEKKIFTPDEMAIKQAMIIEAIKAQAEAPGIITPDGKKHIIQPKTEGKKE